MGDNAATTEALATLARLGICLRRRGAQLDYRASLGAANDHVARYVDRHRTLLLDACREATDYDDVVYPLGVTAGADLNVICLHPISGNAFDYRHLALNLAGECSVYGVQAHRWFVTHEVPATLARMAELYAARLLDHPATRSPFVLYGASSGGYLALEIASRLSAHGRAPALVVLGDTRDSIDQAALPSVAPLVTRLLWVSFIGFCLPLALQDVFSPQHPFWRLADGERLDYLVQRALRIREPMCFAPLHVDALADLFATFGAYARALADHEPSPYPGPAAFLATSDAPPARTEKVRSRLVGGHRFVRIDGKHIEVLRETGARLVAGLVRELRRGTGGGAREPYGSARSAAHGGVASGAA